MGAIEDFYKKLGKDDKKAMLDLNKKTKIDFIPTGSWVINTLIGDGTGSYKPGGLPRGHIVEAYGNESCGKTTLGICACREVQRLGGIPVWLDYERTFSEDYATTLGLDVSQSKFAYFRPDHFEQGARIIADALSMKPMIIVVDSVSAMIPKAFLEGNIDEGGRVGLQAQLMSSFLTIITKSLPDANTNLFFLNQIRSVIKMNKWDRGPSEDSSGGKALKFYASVRLKMETGSIEKVDVISKITGKEDKAPLNVSVKVTVSKNKIDKPYYSAPIYIRFGEGFDNIRSIIDLACNTGAIKKSGAFLSFSHDGKQLFNAQGREQLNTILKENPDYIDLVSKKIVLQQDKETKEQEEALELNENPPENDLDKLLGNVSSNYIGKKAPEDSEEESSEEVVETKPKKKK
jgi:recombination protein RecA